MGIKHWDGAFNMDEDPDNADWIRQAGQMRRSLGAWLGQLTGDALGSQTEFMSEDDVRMDFPDGIQDMGRGYFDTIPGQPTDDSEMAMALMDALTASR